MDPNADYISIAQSESEKDFEQKERTSLRRKDHLNILLLCFNILLIFAIFSLFYLLQRARTDEACIRQLSPWSPALPVLTYSDVTMDGGVDITNKYRGPPGYPSSEVDEAWRRISMGAPGMRIYENELEKLNRLPEAKAYHKLPEENGGGYLAMLEIFHVLHCLDEVRKYTYKEHEHYAEFYASQNTTERNQRVHLDHCIDIIRIHLMCTTDVVPIVFYDDPALTQPFPDFSTLHKCRNFDDLLKWTHANERVVEWDEI